MRKLFGVIIMFFVSSLSWAMESSINKPYSYFIVDLNDFFTVSLSNNRQEIILVGARIPKTKYCKFIVSFENEESAPLITEREELVNAYGVNDEAKIEAAQGLDNYERLPNQQELLNGLFLSTIMREEIAIKNSEAKTLQLFENFYFHTDVTIYEGGSFAALVKRKDNSLALIIAKPNPSFVEGNNDGGPTSGEQFTCSRCVLL